MTMDQLEPEEMPTIADHPIEDLTDPTQPATRGNIRNDPNLTGSSQRTLASHGSLTRHLAKLAKLMFTHQRPYRGTEEGDPIDPNTSGNPTGNNLATLGNFTRLLAAQGNFTKDLATQEEPLPAEDKPNRASEESVHFDPNHLGDPPGELMATLGNLTQLMAAHGNLTRRLIMAFQGPTEAAQDLPHSKDNLPYLPKGNLTEVTFGTTKEITANSQDPDQTINHSRTTFRSPTRSYYGVILENSLLTATYQYLPPLPPIPYFTSPRSTRQPPSMFTSRPYFIIPPTASMSIHHLLSISITPSSLHHITHNGYKILAPTLSLFHFITINYESPHLQETLQGSSSLKFHGSLLQ